MRLYITLLVGVLLLSNCAHLRTSTYKVLDKPNYYLGKMPKSTGKMAVMPLYIRQWRVSYDDQLLRAIEKLKTEMDAYLKQKDFIWLPSIKTNVEDYPVVYFGVVESYDYPGDPEDEEILSQENVDKPLMVIYQESPAKKWKDALAKLCLEKKFQYVLVPFLSIGEFKVYQKDWKGNKEIVLGSQYRQKVAWLTDLNQPVEVLYVGGAIVDCQGKIIRVGAEGMLAKPTKFLPSVFNLQANIASEDVENLLTQRRTDLPDQPLVWQQALENLLMHLIPTVR